MQLGLDDLLADLRYARRGRDLGRLALLAYCEVRRWARDAGESELAAHSSAMVLGAPEVDRDAFLQHIDGLIGELERVQPKFSLGLCAAPAPRPAYAGAPPAPLASQASSAGAASGVEYR
ncbi:MAG: hypothetical protein KGL18_12225 [Burkholderiales bacterium]|nr:hypothetical protein [Burkholderiales bacterium]MDE2503722.1 hypothetical protein [Burkholderiales bacterium]